MGAIAQAPPERALLAPAIVFDGVTYSYPDTPTPALEDVHLEIAEGELCLVAGLTAQGKSTLLHAACGLVPHLHGGAFAGSVTVCSLDTRSHPPARLGAIVGVLFQDPETQLVTSAVHAELALSVEARGAGAAEVARDVEEVALALGIDHLLGRSTLELSGGEKQRVALAAALVGRPRVVVLDEPTSQLDPVAGDELIALLRRLNRDWGITVLLAEHRLERCIADVDRVVAIDAGRIVHDGEPASFLAWAAEHAPTLQTPAARMFSLAGLSGAPVGVKQARARLRELGLPSAAASPAQPPPEGVRGPAGAPRGERRRRRDRGALRALRMKGVWHELRGGAAILRGIDLELAPGESVALMGRNGSGKSTLLRHCAGLLEPTRGTIERAGRVALLLQSPGDYLLRERVGQEASAGALLAAGLAHAAARNPRDLSGGERQRLALAIVSDADEPPALLALDEPTRGMDSDSKEALAAELRSRAAGGQAILVATHDPEFAARQADRVLLLADGRLIADEQSAVLLSGGWYFATETARVLATPDGPRPPLLPEQGAALLERSR